jgi:hypothetical protein
MNWDHRLLGDQPTLRPLARHLSRTYLAAYCLFLFCRPGSPRFRH